FDSRPTARSTPSAKPRAVPHSVSSIVIHSADSTDDAVKYCAKVDQSQPGLVARPCTNWATRINTAALITQRHGCHFRATTRFSSSVWSAGASRMRRSVDVLTATSCGREPSGWAFRECGVWESEGADVGP